MRMLVAMWVERMENLTDSLTDSELADQYLANQRGSSMDLKSVHRSLDSLTDSKWAHQ